MADVKVKFLTQAGTHASESVAVVSEEEAARLIGGGVAKEVVEDVAAVEVVDAAELNK